MIIINLFIFYYNTLLFSYLLALTEIIQAIMKRDGLRHSLLLSSYNNTTAMVEGGETSLVVSLLVTLA